MLIALIIVGVLACAALVKAIQVVPQASAAIVERFGRYRRTLNAGFNIVVPFVDSMRNRFDLREQVVTFPSQSLLTQDNLYVSIDTVIYYQITDPRAATYEIASYIQAMDQLIGTTLRQLIGGMAVERALAAREQINMSLRDALLEAVGRWGVALNRVVVKSIEPPASVRDAMERQMRAERDRQAAVLEAEGLRQSEILRAQAEKDAALIRAETERDVAAIINGRKGAERTVPSQPRREVRPRHQPLSERDPRSIDRYRLTARLGQGGMGTVYLGRSAGERMVAVKVIKPELAADPAFRQRFGREIDTARRVGGFHTASVVDADPHGDPPWLVTEYVPGPSLLDVLRQHGALPIKTVQTLALGIAEALEGIHACGIIHRDLKPSNIIISSTGPRVIDFGIARALDDTAITRTDHVIGTRGFLAPEQLTGARVTFATDLYAFGMVLCHAAGVVPSADESFESALGLLPSRLLDIVTRCLDREPEARPTTTEVIEHLAYGHSPAGDWLPPSLRTAIDLYNASTAWAD